MRERVCARVCDICMEITHPCQLQQEMFNSREVVVRQLPAACKMRTGVTWMLPKFVPSLVNEARTNTER